MSGSIRPLQLTITAGRLLISLMFVLPVIGLSRSSWKSFKSALQSPLANFLALLLAGYYLLATAAFQLAPVAEIALLLSTPPIFILVIRRIRGDIPSNVEVGGALLALIGLGVILFPQISVGEGIPIQHIIGDVLALSAAGFTALYAYVFRVKSEHGRAPDTIGVSILTFVEGSFILILIVALFPSPSGVDSLNEHTLQVLICLGVLSTAFPSIGFAIASKRLPAVVTSIVSLFIPLFAGVFAYLILNEKPSSMFIPGCALVLSGVAMILYRQGSGQVIEVCNKSLTNKDRSCEQREPQNSGQSEL